MSVPSPADLRKLAKAATPGKWWWANGCSWWRLLSKDKFNRDVPVIMPTNHPIDRHVDCNVSREDRDFMEACYPEVVVSLCDRIERSEAAAWYLAKKSGGDGCLYKECENRDEDCSCEKLYRFAVNGDSNVHQIENR